MDRIKVYGVVGDNISPTDNKYLIRMKKLIKILDVAAKCPMDVYFAINHMILNDHIDDNVDIRYDYIILVRNDVIDRVFYLDRDNESCYYSSAELDKSYSFTGNMVFAHKDIEWSAAN